jgi:iron(III) transport system substrate-binding protein
VNQPYLKLPGSNRLRTLPDGLWLHFSPDPADPYADILCIEACSSQQNLLDKRSRIAPSTSSLLAVCPLPWLLGPCQPDDPTPRWKLIRVLRAEPTEALSLPVRDVRVLYGLKSRQAAGSRIFLPDGGADGRARRREPGDAGIARTRERGGELHAPAGMTDFDEGPPCRGIVIPPPCRAPRRGDMPRWKPGNRTMTRRSLLLSGLSALAASSHVGGAAAQAAGAVSGNLVLYTSQLEPDAAATVEAFRRRHPAVTVEWIRGGTGQIMPRLRAEIAAGNPRADVLLLADSLTMEGLRAEGRLRPSPEVRLGGVPSERVGAGRHYFGTKLITMGMVANKRAPFMPRRWADLLDPRARNQVAFPSPAVSGAAAIHVLTLAQDPALGWDYLTKLARAGLQPRGGNGQVVQAVAQGEKAFGIVIDYLPIREAAQGAPLRFIFPEDGVSAVTEPAAILSTTRNAPAAIAFVEFLLSREGQELAARQGFLPADPSVTPPGGFPEPRSIRVLPLDAARAVAESEAALRRFGALVE